MCNIRMNFAKRLIDARTCLNISRKDMATRLGITHSAYCNYELGFREPNFQILKNIAKILQVSIDVLLDNELDYKTNKESFNVCMFNSEIGNVVLEDEATKDVEAIFPCNRIAGLTTLQACQNFCPRYYICPSVAIAQDNLKDFEVMQAVDMEK